MDEEGHSAQRSPTRFWSAADGTICDKGNGSKLRGAGTTRLTDVGAVSIVWTLIRLTTHACVAIKLAGDGSLVVRLVPSAKKIQISKGLQRERRARRGKAAIGPAVADGRSHVGGFSSRPDAD